MNMGKWIESVPGSHRSLMHFSVSPQESSASFIVVCSVDILFLQDVLTWNESQPFRNDGDGQACLPT
jgi:hypothetical protein